MKITLQEWADLHFAQTKPSVRTMRRWAAQGKLVPTAERIGRTLYVTPETSYKGRSRGELARALERSHAGSKK